MEVADKVHDEFKRERPFGVGFCRVGEDGPVFIDRLDDAISVRAIAGRVVLQLRRGREDRNVDEVKGRGAGKLRVPADVVGPDRDASQFVIERRLLRAGFPVVGVGL
jgi:hypothetical protein